MTSVVSFVSNVSPLLLAGRLGSCTPQIPLCIKHTQISPYIFAADYELILMIFVIKWKVDFFLNRFLSRKPNLFHEWIFDDLDHSSIAFFFGYYIYTLSFFDEMTFETLQISINSRHNLTVKLLHLRCVCVRCAPIYILSKVNITNNTHEHDIKW